MTAILQLTGVAAAHGPVEVRGVDLAVEEGGITALLGADAAGRTATLRPICRRPVRTAEETSPGGARIVIIGVLVIEPSGLFGSNVSLPS